MTTPTITDINTVYYCPVCGAPMRVFVQEYGHGIPSVTMIECLERACSLWKNTTSPSMVLSGRYQDDWKYIPIYDLLTGEEIARD